MLTAAMPFVAPAVAAPDIRKAFEYQHAPVPLPFDAKTLKDLSEKLILSHWDNNHRGSVNALNGVRTRLTQALSDANTPPYIYSDLKREQLLRIGSVALHELHFANLFDVDPEYPRYPSCAHGIRTCRTAQSLRPAQGSASFRRLDVMGEANTP